MWVRMQRWLSHPIHNSTGCGHWPDAWSHLEASKGGNLSTPNDPEAMMVWPTTGNVLQQSSSKAFSHSHIHIHRHRLVAEATMQGTTCSSGGIITHKQSHSDGRATRNNLGFSTLPKTCRMQDAALWSVDNFSSQSPVWRLYCDLWWWTD